MQKHKIEKILSKLKGSEGSYPFGPEVLVFKVMGKMFALVSKKEQIPKITLKCVPADAEILVSQFKSITPGYYMNKKHWITILLIDELSESRLINLVNNSYNLVVNKLTKADQERLEHQ